MLGISVSYGQAYETNLKLYNSFNPFSNKVSKLYLTNAIASGAAKILM